MSFNRYAKRKDSTRDAIVDALRKAGWEVWDIGRPVDLLCWKSTKGFRCLECKSPRNKNGDPKMDKRRVEQDKFIEMTGARRVCTPFEALLAVGETVEL